VDIVNSARWNPDFVPIFGRIWLIFDKVVPNFSGNRSVWQIRRLSNLLNFIKFRQNSANLGTLYPNLPNARWTILAVIWIERVLLAPNCSESERVLQILAN
jgi:hypothetical protein